MPTHPTGPAVRPGVVASGLVAAGLMAAVLTLPGSGPRAQPLAPPSAGVSLDPQPILPGYWESVNSVLSPLPSRKVERRCITPKDVAKFLSGPANHHYTCTYPTRIFSGGRIRLKGECVDKRGRTVEIEGSGRYEPTRFTLTADIDTRLAGLPISGRARTEAVRISDICPKGAPGGEGRRPANG